MKKDLFFNAELLEPEWPVFVFLTAYIRPVVISRGDFTSSTSVLPLKYFSFYIFYIVLSFFNLFSIVYKMLQPVISQPVKQVNNIFSFFSSQVRGFRLWEAQDSKDERFWGQKGF